jgi:hypothetical protein
MRVVDSATDRVADALLGEAGLGGAGELLLAACLSQPAVASVSHFFMKLFFAAPASFFSVDCALQLVCA